MKYRYYVFKQITSNFLIERLLYEVTTNLKWHREIKKYKKLLFDGWPKTFARYFIIVVLVFFLTLSSGVYPWVTIFLIQAVVANAAWLVIENNLLELRVHGSKALRVIRHVKFMPIDFLRWNKQLSRAKEFTLESRVPLKRYTFVCRWCRFVLTKDFADFF